MSELDAIKEKLECQHCYCIPHKKGRNGDRCQRGYQECCRCGQMQPEPTVLQFTGEDASGWGTYVSWPHAQGWGAEK